MAFKMPESGGSDRGGGRSKLDRLFRTRGGVHALRDTMPKSALDAVKSQQSARERGAGEGLPLTVSSKQQALFRQAHMAHQLLVRNFGEPLHKASADLARVPVKADAKFMPYEKGRFSNDLLWMNLAHEQSPPVIEELHVKSRWLVGQDEAFFEDLFHAGLGTLNGGDAKSAIDFLHLAQQAWPVTDRSYGSVHLALVSAYAVDNQLDPVVTGMEDFKEVYPDWMYIELFAKDLEEFHDVYGDIGALYVLRARLSQLVHDDRTASELYEKAFRAGLTGDSVQEVREWQAAAKSSSPK